MKELTKDEEIKLLTQLGMGNGYFAQVFKKDLPAMINNINDFKITYLRFYLWNMKKWNSNKNWLSLTVMQI